MTLTVISPPGEAALPLAEAKAFLRVGHDGEDTLIGDLVAGAQARLETAAGLVLVTQTLRHSVRAWPSSLTRQGIRLWPGPAASLVSVRIVDAGSNADDVTGQFELVDGRLKVRATSWCPPIPVGGEVQIDVVAGYGAASDVPEDLIHALKLILLDAYRRNGEPGLPAAAETVLKARREVLL
ncbi:MAG: hypothetical protein WA989_11955 [Henriciella sp.]|uniref:head-tail connector protein n=1 Tax=Henriciella sp. TaxID=1968823 RepID=UPI003C73B8A8